MKRFAIGAAFGCALLAPYPAQAGPEPVEYVRVCQMYGTGFYYIPGTEQCYNVNTGQIRYEVDAPTPEDPDRTRTIVTETPFAARVRELEAQAAIAIALEDPDLVAGEKFGLRVNWGTTETTSAIGVTGAILLGDNLAAGGMRITGNGGLGFADGYVGARFGVQANF